MDKFTNGSEYPGIAHTLDHSVTRVPVLYEWYPCLNNQCGASSRSAPPYTRAGVSNFAIVSNPEVKCRFCYTQYLPINSQGVVQLFQQPLVQQLAGKLGPLHPKFRGSKLYGMAEQMLEVNTANFDPSKPPVFDTEALILPTPAQWLEAKTGI